MPNRNDIKSIISMVDSLKQVKSFPDFVRREIGSSLYDAQCGEKPHNAKPFKGIGGGVFEIVTRFDSDTYRTVYALQIGNSIYVLHAFQKKSPKGIKTAQKDVDLIKKRYKQAVEKSKEKKQ
ncbi:MAG: type II toxin-antitoxin system RelE/ParE family toxin [Xenococcaceae cyanobacterium MO_167.B27]|nr:type II toxin-antitoxin system RelE/ParE family toxin [Xenococcaceae cyanobacterium MO_167.B27]